MKAARWIGLAGLAAMFVYTALCWSAPRFWIGELACNLRWQMGLLGLVPLALLCIARRPIAAAAAFLVVAIHLTPALSLYVPRQASTEDGPVLRVATLNLLWEEGNHELLEEWVEAEDIELLALQELDHSRLPWLDSLRARFPFQLRFPALNESWTKETWGSALLSRHPFESTAVHSGNWQGQPVLEARVDWKGEPLVVFAAHPMRPGKAWRNESRDAALAVLGEAAADEPRALVMGDLNATLYSPAFERLLSAAELADSRQGFGRQASWTGTGYLFGRRLPFTISVDLDHILLGRELDVLDRQLGPELGSDHLPVMAVIRLRERDSPDQPTETLPRKPSR